MRDVWERARRACGYLLVALGAGTVSMVMLPLTVAVALTVVAAGLGYFALPRWLGVVRAWADLHHGRAARLLGLPTDRGPAPDRSRFAALFTAPSTRRDLVWLLLFPLTSVPAGIVALLTAGLAAASVLLPFWWALPAGSVEVFGVPVTGWGTALTGIAVQLGVSAALGGLVLSPLARAHARVNFRLLAPSEAELLAGRVDELTRTRADVVDAHGAELRRIERDLHDGTQARLVSIAMQLGVAEEAVQGDPRVAALLREAHTGAEEAMEELRDVIRGIYPPILADRGLVGALRALAARTTVPTRLDAGALGALPAAAETAAYFVVTEAVTNAVRHGGAGQITVRLARRGGVLRVAVHDDGVGGVDESRGSGVVGIRRRVAALDGTVRVSGPVGGPTEVEVELPCGS